MIIVSTNKDAALSPSAKKFNMLLKKLEQVKKQQETMKTKLEQNLQDVHREIMPSYGELCELQADFLFFRGRLLCFLLFLKFFKSRAISLIKFGILANL